MSVIRVSVTPLDIASGNAGEPCSCPIALAIARALRMPFRPWVEKTAVDFNDGEEYPLPDEVTRFIERFDAAKTVDPFDFEMEVPDNVVTVTAL